MISSFTFKPSGYGHYFVEYTSPKTGRKWSCITDNMPLMDRTRNCESPKVKDLEMLKKLCKKY